MNKRDFIPNVYHLQNQGIFTYHQGTIKKDICLRIARFDADEYNQNQEKNKTTNIRRIRTDLFAEVAPWSAKGRTRRAVVGGKADLSAVVLTKADQHGCKKSKSAS